MRPSGDGTSRRVRAFVLPGSLVLCFGEIALHEVCVGSPALGWEARSAFPQVCEGVSSSPSGGLLPGVVFPALPLIPTD